MINWYLTISACLAAASWTSLIVWYSIRAKWWKTHVGQNTMGVSVVLTLLLIRLSVLLATPPYTPQRFWETVFGVTFYLALAFLGLQRVYFVEQSQRQASRMNQAHNRRWNDPK
jgi:hypothetical protein